MKTYSRIILAAFAAAFGLASCAHEELAPAEKPQGRLVTVHFGAESQIATTKATLTTEDEKTFKSAWENGDLLSVEYSYNYGNPATTTAEWKGSNFEAQLAGETGPWMYDAVYPAPDSDMKADFGSSRKQNGNLYNSKYDFMYGSATAENAPAGKTDDGKDIVFNMNRQTAIAYFHLTGTLDEDVVSAKLSVEGEIACLATSSAEVKEYAKGYEFGDTGSNALKEITITFDDGTAPKASNFKLWFNVLPTIYSKMTLNVETTGHTLTISKTAKDGDDGTYEAGKLYKVVKEIPAEKWVAKTTPTPEQSYTIEFNSFTKVETSPTKTTKATTFITSGSEYVTSQPFSEISSCFYGGDATNGKPLRVGTSSKAGSITIALSDLGKVNATKIVLSAKQYSSGKSKSIGVNGSAKLKPEDDYIDLSFELNGEELSSIKLDSDGYIYIKSITVIAGVPKTSLDTPANLSVSETKTVSWDAVSGAASYSVTIGTQTFTAEINSYDASAVEDEYYDVAVVAVPSDTENYKNSAAATLTAAKFGTPTLATPVLKEGAIEETSINVTWSVDSRATEGYYCEIYNGEDKVAEDLAAEGSVTFSGLAEGQAYTIKVNAESVSGEKPYAASGVAAIELTTKSAYQVKDVSEAGTYTIKNLMVYAVPNNSNAIVGDGTGYILFYKRGHNLSVGDVFDAAGSVKIYNGVWEYDNATTSNLVSGAAPEYSGVVEATESYLTKYAENPVIEYVHAKGVQSGRYISVGSQKLYLSVENAATDGKSVEVYGFAFGYSSQYSNVSFAATSIQEDQTIPSLSIDKTSKTWASTETDDFVVNVSVNAEGGDWTVSPTELSWAAVAINKETGTITVTPNGENTSAIANEATLTVTHASDATLTKTITLKQNAAGSAVETKNGKITFGSAEGSINANEATVTGTDATGTKWTITTVGTTSFTPNPSYSQLGASKKPATSITIVGQNASAKKIESVSVKFGGFSDTAGIITIKVGDTQVGSGKLYAAEDVIVKSTSVVDGNTITISVTSISKGVKLYSIEYTYTE